MDSGIPIRIRQQEEEEGTPLDPTVQQELDRHLFALDRAAVTTMERIRLRQALIERARTRQQLIDTSRHAS